MTESEGVPKRERDSGVEVARRQLSEREEPEALVHADVGFLGGAECFAMEYVGASAKESEVDAAQSEDAARRTVVRLHTGSGEILLEDDVVDGVGRVHESIGIRVRARQDIMRAAAVPRIECRVDL